MVKARNEAGNSEEEEQEDPDIHVLDGWMPARKIHPARTIHKDRL